MIMTSHDVKITSYFLNGGHLSPPSLKIYCKNGKNLPKLCLSWSTLQVPSSTTKPIILTLSCRIHHQLSIECTGALISRCLKAFEGLCSRENVYLQYFWQQ